MIKKVLANVLFWLILASACQHHAPKTALITGTLADASGLNIVLQEMDTHEIHAKDSVAVDNTGSFSLNPVIVEPGFWLMKAISGKVLVLFMRPGDTISLVGSMQNFPDNITLYGPKETMMLNDFFQKTRINERLVDSLELMIAERQDSSDFYQFTQKLDTSFKQIWENQRDLEIAYITKHNESLTSLIVLNYSFGMSPVLSPEEDLVYYKKLDSALFVKFPENNHVKYHHQRVQEMIKKISGAK